MQTHSTALLPAPSLAQINEQGALSLSVIKEGIHVTVPVYPGMKVGDQITIPWEGTPSHPEVGFAAMHIITSSSEPQTYAIHQLNVYEKWQQLKVWYHVKGIGDSETVTVDIVP